MKRKWPIFGILMILLTSISSCVNTDDFETPKADFPEVVIEGNTTSISGVKGQFDRTTGEIFTFNETQSYFTGYVISSDEGGNFYKKLVVQDKPENPTAGIQILIDDPSLFNSFNFGRKVHIKLDGLSLGFKNGLLQLGIQNRGDIVSMPRSIIDNHIIRTSETAEIIPLEMDISAFSENLKNTYIKLSGVQFNRNLVREEHRFTYASEPIDRFDGERQIESCETGATTILSTSTFADFRSLILPKFSGSIEGVLSRNFTDDHFIIIVNTPEGLNFNGGERCDPVFFSCGGNQGVGIETVFQESFETITTVRMLGTRGWTNVNVSGGSKVFEPGTLGGNRHVRISAYNTQESPLQAWLITPGINLNSIEEEVLTFDIRASFDNSTILEVLITSAFTGNPLTTEWKLLEARIPIGPSNQAGANFVRSTIDISCFEGEIHVAFRYLGAAPDKTTTYDIDNVRVTGI